MTSTPRLWRELPRTSRFLLAILVLSVCLRLVVAIYLGDTTPPGKDETSYSVLAWRLATGNGFSFPEPWYPFAQANAPTAHWSFLFTGMVAAVYRSVGFHPMAFRLMSAVAGGTLLPYMAFLLAKRVLPGRQEVALTTAALTAVYAYFVLFAAQLMTETFYIIAVLWSLERAYAIKDCLQAGRRPGWWLVLVFGLSLGLGVLFRQAILPWLALLFGLILLEGLRVGQGRSALLAIATAGGVVLLLVLPFTVRNYRAYGEFLLLNSNAGYAMYSAQHPLHGTEFQAFTAAPLPADLDPAPANEAQWDRALMKRGIQFILEEPGRYALLSLSRMADYFKFWPSDESSTVFNVGRVLSFGLFLPFIVAGLWISRANHSRLAWLYTFAAFYSILHILTWSMIRYRLPVDGVLLIFAALAVLQVATRLREWPILHRLLVEPREAEIGSE